MELSFHLVSNLNIYNLAFASMTSTLKDIKEEQISRHQHRVLCDSLRISMERNTRKLQERTMRVKKSLKYQKNITDREMTISLLNLVGPYEDNVLKIQDILNQPIDGETYDRCLPILNNMTGQMEEIISTMQKDLKITTKARF